MCGWNGGTILFDISEVGFTVEGAIGKVDRRGGRMYCTAEGMNSSAHGFKLRVMAIYNCCAYNIPQNISL